MTISVSDGLRGEVAVAGYVSHDVLPYENPVHHQNLRPVAAVAAIFGLRLKETEVVPTDVYPKKNLLVVTEDLSFSAAVADC